jgi:hypothetical protein
VLSEDLILPTSSGKVNIKAFCVEQGRWTQRGRESVQAFAAAPSAIATPELKRAVKQAANQRAVWTEVSAAQDRLAVTLGAPVKSVASESSYQLSLEAPKVKQRTDNFKKALSGLADRHSDALGYVMAVNGKVTGADLYATHTLFRKLWPKLLDAAAVEAMALVKPAGAVAMPRMEDVRAAASGNGTRVSSEVQVNRRTTGVKADLPGGLVFETRDTEMPAVPLHRSYLAK